MKLPALPELNDDGMTTAEYAVGTEVGSSHA